MNVLFRLKKGDVFYNFVTGGAGTGKSRLISAIDQTVNRFFDKLIPDDQDYDSEGNKLIRVLLCAFTGKAFSKILFANFYYNFPPFLKFKIVSF